MSGGAVFASPVIPGERVERPMQLVFPCSILKTCIGSIRDARHAGAVQASAAEASRSTATATKTLVSKGLVS
jgi:hypothetical protein